MPSPQTRTRTRTRPGTWQTLGVNIVGEVLRTIGWNVRMRRMRWGLRIRQYVTLATVMASVGTAIGYAVATRNVTDEDRHVDPDEAE